jgi:hypothetical protein
VRSHEAEKTANKMKISRLLVPVDSNDVTFLSGTFITLMDSLPEYNPKRLLGFAGTAVVILLLIIFVAKYDQNA